MELIISDVISKLNRSVETNQFLLKSFKQIKSLEADPIKNVYGISSTIDAIKSKLTQSSEFVNGKKTIDEWLNAYTVTIESNKKQLHDSFGRALESFIKAKNIELKGQFPELKAGIFTIEVDFNLGNCQLWYGPRQELLLKTKLDPEEVSHKIESLMVQLNAPINESSLIQQLHTAYLNIIRKQNRQEGERAEIIQILNELALIRQDNRFHINPLKEYYKEYTRAQFSYDLFRINKNALGTKSLVLVGAVRMDAVSRTGFIWVPSDEKGNGSSFGYLYFKEAANG
jgi:hypothetical protein